MKWPSHLPGEHSPDVTQKASSGQLVGLELPAGISPPPFPLQPRQDWGRVCAAVTEILVWAKQPSLLLGVGQGSFGYFMMSRGVICTNPS